MTKRIYTPAIGQKVKLATWDQYREYAHDVPMWSWFQVLGIDTDTGYLEARIQHIDAGKLGNTYTIPLSAIQPPLGWQERYTITVSPAKLTEVLSWLSRGIVVRQSQYIGDASTQFQPMDNANQSHWKYGEVTDVIPADQTRDLIRVVVFEVQYDVGIPAPCKYCTGGKRTPENSPGLVGTDYNVRCPKCDAHTGFSFTETYHFDACRCESPYAPGECWVCNGTGQGVKHLSELSRKDRQAPIRAMQAEGWHVHYVRRNGIGWMRERETTVKDFGQEVS